VEEPTVGAGEAPVQPPLPRGVICGAYPAASGAAGP